MTLDFTKIRWAGQDVVLVTIREHAREGAFILGSDNIEDLNKCWNETPYQNPEVKDKLSNSDKIKADNYVKEVANDIIKQILDKDYGK